MILNSDQYPDQIIYENTLPAFTCLTDIASQITSAGPCAQAAKSCQ